MYCRTPTQRWLIVDDDRSARLALRCILTHFQIESVEARDGLEAWQILERSRVDGVVTDIDMPRWNGVSLLRRIRNSPEKRIQDLPVLVMSSHTEIPGTRDLISRRSTYFLPKPIDIRSLGAFIQLSRVGLVAPTQ